MKKMIMYRRDLMYVFLKIMIVCALVNLWGCTAVVPVATHQSEIPGRQENILPDTKGWWHARFRIDWPEAKEPNWYIGALLAGEVISPVLRQYRSQLDLWRFHRRASRDGQGHVFSFIFFSSAQTAQTVYSAIEKNPLLITLQQEKKIKSVGFDNVYLVAKPGIAETSDRNWPDSVRKSWPTFIMGASQMWLDLVLELVSDQKAELSSEIVYRDVQQQISNLWMHYGRHAWLHHLNGIFAYQPMLMRY